MYYKTPLHLGNVIKKPWYLTIFFIFMKSFKVESIPFALKEMLMSLYTYIYASTYDSNAWSSTSFFLRDLYFKILWTKILDKHTNIYFSFFRIRVMVATVHERKMWYWWFGSALGVAHASLLQSSGIKREAYLYCIQVGCQQRLPRWAADGCGTVDGHPSWCTQISKITSRPSKTDSKTF